MLTLGIDTSGRTASAALVRGGELLGNVHLDEGLTHSQTLLPAIDRLLAEAEVSKADIEKIAVCVGPGSFTGLRIGVGTAKGLGMALGVPVAAVGTLRAIASSVLLDGSSERAIACIDARRGTVYCAEYDRELNEVSSPSQRPLEELVGEGNARVASDLEVAGGLAQHAARLGEAQAGMAAGEAQPFYLRQALEYN